ncbi:MAG: IS91 family transposase, partial [Thermoanaerobaculia bacterium]
TLPQDCAALYRPRKPRDSPLYQLIESRYDEVKGQWEERFERRFGFWRGAVEDAVFAFLDCGIYEHGFARVVCNDCRAEFLVAFSCQRRGLCPSCAAKRGAIFGALLAEEVLDEVGHALWTFTIPRMLRPYFLHHRELLGELCRAGWEVVRELMVAATQRPDLQPGMVSVVHTAGDLLGWHPHAHAIASRGGWDADGQWVPVPFVGTGEAERLFQHRVIALLRDQGLLSDERIELLLSWRHSGFSVHNTVRVAAGDTAGIERLGRYLLRSPVAVERLLFDLSTGEVLYHPKQHHDRGKPRAERLEPAEFLARLLQHVPEPRLHQVRYYGRYSNVARARRSLDETNARPAMPPHREEPDTAERRQARRAWAQLIRRVYEVDPLICQQCGGKMRVVAFLLDPAAIGQILAHLARQARLAPRGPPAPNVDQACAAS